MYVCVCMDVWMYVCIVCACEGETHDLTNAFWNSLVGLIELLEPLKEATDLCQSNKATM